MPTIKKTSKFKEGDIIVHNEYGLATIERVEFRDDRSTIYYHSVFSAKNALGNYFTEDSTIGREVRKTKFKEMTARPPTNINSAANDRVMRGRMMGVSSDSVDALTYSMRGAHQGIYHNIPDSGENYGAWIGIHSIKVKAPKQEIITNLTNDSNNREEVELVNSRSSIKPSSLIEVEEPELKVKKFKTNIKRSSINF